MTNYSNHVLSQIEALLHKQEATYRENLLSGDTNPADSGEEIRLTRSMFSCLDNSLPPAKFSCQLNLGLAAVREIIGDTSLIESILDVLSRSGPLLNAENKLIMSPRTEAICERDLIQEMRQRGALDLALISTYISKSSKIFDYFGLYFLEPAGFSVADKPHQNLATPISAVGALPELDRLRMRKFLASYAHYVVIDVLGFSSEEGDDVSKIDVANDMFYDDSPGSRTLLKQLQLMRPEQSRDEVFDFPSYVMPLAENNLEESKQAKSQLNDRRFKFAKFLFLICLEHRRLEFGEKHPAFAACLDSIARCLQVHQLHEPAIEYFSLAYKLAKTSRTKNLSVRLSHSS